MTLTQTGTAMLPPLPGYRHLGLWGKEMSYQTRVTITPSHLWAWLKNTQFFKMQLEHRVFKDV